MGPWIWKSFWVRIMILMMKQGTLPPWYFPLSNIKLQYYHTAIPSSPPKKEYTNPDKNVSSTPKAAYPIPKWNTQLLGTFPYATLLIYTYRYKITVSLFLRKLSYPVCWGKTQYQTVQRLIRYYAALHFIYSDIL